MSSRRSTTRRTARALAAALVIVGIAAPIAAADTGAESSGIVRRVEAPMPETTAPTVTQTIDDGFDWASAAIGAAGAGLVLLLAAVGVSVAARRHRAPGVAG